MNDEAQPNRNRLAEVKFDEKSIPLGYTDRDHECAAAVFDLIADNRFGVRDRDDGPYSLHIARVESRLAFDVRTSAGAPVVGESVSDIELPEGSLIISVLRAGGGFVPKADTVIEAGDEVLLVLDPGLEPAITAFFAAAGSRAEA